MSKKVWIKKLTYAYAALLILLLLRLRTIFLSWTYGLPRSLSICSRREPLRNSETGFLQTGCPSCHPVSKYWREHKALTPTNGQTSFFLQSQPDSRWNGRCPLCRLSDVSSYKFYMNCDVTRHQENELAATLRWFTAGGAIRIAYYDVIDDIITRKLQHIEKNGDHLTPWNRLSYPMAKTASLCDNFCKTGNDVIYDVVIWVQDGNCKKWLLEF